MALIANASGAVVLAGTVTAGTFAGPPILIAGDDLTSTSDVRFAAVSRFCDVIGARVGRSVPLIGIKSNDLLQSTADLVTLIAALKTLSVFFDVNQAGGFRWSNGSTYDVWPVLGPIFCVPSDADAGGNAQFGWFASASFVRLTANNLFGIGAMGCGATVPDVQLSPPVYNFGKTTYQRQLNTLVNVWQRGGPVTASNVATLQAAEAISGRTGISRKTHPALAPYVLLSVP